MQWTVHYVHTGIYIHKILKNNITVQPGCQCRQYKVYSTGSYMPKMLKYIITAHSSVLFHVQKMTETLTGICNIQKYCKLTKNRTVKFAGPVRVDFKQNFPFYRISF